MQLIQLIVHKYIVVVAVAVTVVTLSFVVVTVVVAIVVTIVVVGGGACDGGCSGGVVAGGVVLLFFAWVEIKMLETERKISIKLYKQSKKQTTNNKQQTKPTSKIKAELQERVNVLQ